MKIKSIILGLTAAVSLAACGGEKLISNSDRVVFMGDSITYYGVSDSHGYVNLVQKGLAANGIEPAFWKGVGIKGDVSQQMRDRFDSHAGGNHVTPYNPTVVTISAGVNDLLHNVSYDTFIANMKWMVDRTKAIGATPILLSPTATGYSEDDADSLRQFAKGVKDLAASEGIAYAPIYEYFRGYVDDHDSPATAYMNKDIIATCDACHMGPAGDRQFARAVLGAIGLTKDELSTAEAAWNRDDTLIPLGAYSDWIDHNVTIKLSAAEAAAVTSAGGLHKILERGIPSLAANPVAEAEASGAANSYTVNKSTGYFNFKQYDQLLIAARKLNVNLESAIRYAVLRGVRNTAALAPGAPVVKAAVHPGSTTATIDATIESVGATAGSCDVFLKLNSGASERIVVGESATFDYQIKNLQPNTTYTYELTFVNNATTAKSVTESGSFTTLAAGPLQPSDWDDSAMIQAAIDAAAPNGTVTLAGGVFNLGAELILDNGVKLVGQGMTATILRQHSPHRVMTVKGGATVEGVTLEGAKTSESWVHGAGAYVDNGTISHCRIWRNRATGGNVYGVGVYFNKGSIDHSIIADNIGSGTGSGGGIGSYNTAGTITIDSCLICGNSRTSGKAGGAAFVMNSPQVTIRNTTITDNTSSSDVAGLLNDGYSGAKVTLVNCIVAGNTVGSTAADVSGTLASGSSNNVTGGTPSFADAANGDYHLDAAYVEAIGKGVTYTGIGTDLDGASFANPPSVGCYEYNGTPCAAKPAFAPASCAFYPSISVSLSCATAGATIRYTTNGSDPTDSSAVYNGPINLSATTTVKARAFKADMDPSAIVSATYTYEKPEDPVAPTLGTVTVTPAATKATVSGSITSLGNNGASACDVYLSLNGAAATKLGNSAAGAFSYSVTGLTTETTYSYTLSISNNATTVMGAATSGSFTTTAKPAGIEPGASAAENTATIQDAIDAAASGETVTLGEGTFEIDTQLIVDHGVTLAGQGWDKTIIKQTGPASDVNRVVKIDGGAKVVGVTLTGGKTNVNWKHGAGAWVTDGTLSWCCIRDNQATGNNIYGGGVYVEKAVIDHCIITGNTAGGSSGNGGGIGGYPYMLDVDVTIDTCLIYGNTATSANGGGIGFKMGTPKVVIRNTTIADNTSSAAGGGIYFESGMKNITLVNSIVSGNVVASSEDNVSATLATGSQGNLIGGSPDFVDAANGDFRLGSSSAAIGLGVWYQDIAEDLDQVERGNPNCCAGCYEYSGTTPPAPHTHVWGTPTYTWSSDYKTCTASATCTGNSSHKTNVTVNAKYEVVTVATETTDGEGRYTATFAAPFATQTKSVTIPKTGTDDPIHDDPPVVDPTDVTGDYYVSPTGSDSASGSADHPFATIAKAVQTATAGQTVCVLAGTYEISAAIEISKDITVVGQGWEHTVVKPASGSKIRCFKLSSGAKLVGLTITGANSTSRGAAVQVENGSISWCCISNNTSSAGNYAGGAVCIRAGSIDHSVIANNTYSATGWGAGVGSIGDMTDNATIDTCLFFGNNAENGSGGAIGFDKANKNVTVSNCTIVGNTGKYNCGGIYMCNGSGLITLVNNIIVGNKGGGADRNVGIKEAQLDKTNSKFCLLGTSTSDSNAGWGDKDFIANLASSGFTSGAAPFVGNGDYRLTEAKELGYTDNTGTCVDLDHCARSGSLDVGCYEFGGVPPAPVDPIELGEVTTKPSTNYNGNVVTVAFTGDVPDGATVSAKVTLDGHDYAGTVDGKSVSFVIPDDVVTAGNVYEGVITLTVGNDSYTKDVTLEQGTLKVDEDTAWIKESATTFDSTGSWSGDKAVVASGKISVSNATFTAAKSAPKNGVVTIASTFAFGDAADEAFESSPRAGILVVKAGGVNRYAYKTAAGVVTNFAVVAKTDAPVRVVVTLDTAANTVAYTVDGTEIGSAAMTAREEGVSSVRYIGATEVSALDGAYRFEGLDANLAKAGGVEYATVAEAVAAGKGAVELLWDTTWEPSAAGDYTFAQKGFGFAIGGPLAYSVKDNGDGTVTVTVTGGETPEAPEAASITLAGSTVKVAVADVESDLWYALEKTTDLTKPFALDAKTWKKGTDLLKGESLEIALGSDKQAFYRVVVSTTAP